MECLDSVARRYGVLPSAVVGETNQFKALTLNLWAHNYGVQRDYRLQKQAQGKG